MEPKSPQREGDRSIHGLKNMCINIGDHGRTISIVNQVFLTLLVSRFLDTGKECRCVGRSSVQTKIVQKL